MPETQRPVEIVYIGDPMCSWCWGFAPVLDRLVQEHDVPFTLIVGGLRPGPSAQTLEPALRGQLLHHWEAVAAASGQPFNVAALENRSAEWVYDTEFPARAVVTMRRFSPQQELAFFTRLQRAFYAEGLDITSPDVYPGLLEPFAVEPDEFMAALATEDSRELAWADFRWAHERRVRGFPTTLLRIEDRLRMLSGGYQPYAQVDAIFHAVLERFAPYDPVSLTTCSGAGSR